MAELIMDAPEYGPRARILIYAAGATPDPRPVSVDQFEPFDIELNPIEKAMEGVTRSVFYYRPGLTAITPDTWR